jgi:hypothetical protein
MYLKRQNIYLKIGYGGWEGEWWEVLEVLKVVNSFQEFAFMFCLYLDFVVLLTENKYPNIENSKGL